MVWTPKSTAPPTFNLVDAFIALITGDPIWGWLLDWLPYITNDHFSTSDFCAFGPTIAPDLSPIFSPSPPDRSPAAAAAKIATIAVAVAMAARERVFEAYCEIAAPPAGGPTIWDPPICVSIDTTNFHGSAMRFVDVPSNRQSMRFTTPDCPTNLGRSITAYQGSPDPPLSNIGAFGGAVGSAPLISGTIPGNAVWYYPNGSSGYSCSACVEFGLTSAGTGDPYTAASQPEPTGLLSPLRPVDPTLDGIAAEVTSLEFKMDTVLTILQAVAGSTIDLGGDAGDPTDLPPDAPLDVSNAAGVILIASGVPASRSLDFGTPQYIVKLARINLGNASGWYPSIWMTHTPFVLRPLPQGVTQITVTDIVPGASVTSRLISKTK